MQAIKDYTALRNFFEERKITAPDSIKNRIVFGDQSENGLESLRSMKDDQKLPTKVVLQKHGALDPLKNFDHEKLISVNTETITDTYSDRAGAVNFECHLGKPKTDEKAFASALFKG